MILPDWQDKTILIVEDDEVSMEYLTELLIPSKVKVLAAIDGKQAVDYCLKDESMNVVLMDVRLPKMNGKEAMQEIKKKKPELPIIAQTAFAMSGDKEKYIESGFDDYVSKPIIMTDLIDKISKLLNK